MIPRAKISETRGIKFFFKTHFWEDSNLKIYQLRFQGNSRFVFHENDASDEKISFYIFLLVQIFSYRLFAPAIPAWNQPNSSICNWQNFKLVSARKIPFFPLYTWNHFTRQSIDHESRNTLYILGVGIDQRPLYHGETCTPRFIAEPHYGDTSARGFAGINCHSNRRRIADDCRCWWRWKAASCWIFSFLPIDSTLCQSVQVCMYVQ